jgi:hypothetical protein
MLLQIAIPTPVRQDGKRGRLRCSGAHPFRGSRVVPSLLRPGRSKGSLYLRVPLPRGSIPPTSSHRWQNCMQFIRCVVAQRMDNLRNRMRQSRTFGLWEPRAGNRSEPPGPFPSPQTHGSKTKLLLSVPRDDNARAPTPFPPNTMAWERMSLNGRVGSTHRRSWQISVSIARDRLLGRCSR